MAKDVNDDYYYDAGTVNEQFENYQFYEKSGELHIHDERTDDLVKVTSGGSLEPKSVSTERTHTRSRGPQYVVHTDGSTVYADSPSGAVASSSSWLTVMEALRDTVSDREHIHFQNGQYAPDGKIRFDVPVSLTANGARLVPENDTFDYIFESDVPSDNGDQYARRAVEVSGFDCDMRSYDGHQHGFIQYLGATSNIQITNNHVRYWDGMAAFRGDGPAATHVWEFVGNKMPQPGSNSNTRGVWIGSSWNIFMGNDLGGGIQSVSNNPNWIISNSIFGGPSHGVNASEGDKIGHNVIIDNDKHGIDCSEQSYVTIDTNTIMNNSGELDDIFSGIQLKGTSGTHLKEVLVTGNRCYNRDPTRAGSGNGLQAYGIDIFEYLDDCLIAGDNHLVGNESGALNVTSPTFSNTRVEDPKGSGRTAGSTRPTQPYQGMPFFDTDDGQPIFYDGSEWVDATGTSI